MGMLFSDDTCYLRVVYQTISWKKQVSSSISWMGPYLTDVVFTRNKLIWRHSGENGENFPSGRPWREINEWKGRIYHFGAFGGLQSLQSLTTLAPFTFLHSARVISLQSPLIQQLIFFSTFSGFFVVSAKAKENEKVKTVIVRRMSNLLILTSSLQQEF